MSLHDLRNELRSLRKDSVKPISKMRKGDIASEIERLKKSREETPASASVPSAPPRAMKSSVESIKKAKASEFPVEPAPKASVKPGKAKSAEPAPKKKASKMERMMKILDDMSDTDEE